MNYNDHDSTNLMLMISLHRCLGSIVKTESGVIAEHGITMPQFGVLEFLYHKGAQKISEIIKKTLSSGGNMTVVIDNLEKCGMVERLADPNDRRAKLVSLTLKGRELIVKVFPLHLKNLKKTLSILTIDEKNQFITLAQKLGLSVQEQLTHSPKLEK